MLLVTQSFGARSFLSFSRACNTGSNILALVMNLGSRIPLALPLFPRGIREHMYVRAFENCKASNFAIRFFYRISQTSPRENKSTRRAKGRGAPRRVSRKGVAPSCTTTVLTERLFREREVERARGREP